MMWLDRAETLVWLRQLEFEVWGEIKVDSRLGPLLE